MRLSKSCLYGIWATIYLASINDREFIPIREISDKLDIPFHFLTKILQLLAKADVVVSLRGANGGVSLAKNAEKIFLKDVIIAVDGSGTFSDCVLGLTKCDAKNPCPLHEKWSPIKDQVENLAFNTSLLALANNANKTKWLKNPMAGGKRLPINGERLFKF